MAYASRAGRARTSPTRPQAHAICQRCGFRVNRVDMINQPEWRGAALLPINIYVCGRCLDVPQEQLRAIVLPADPVPVLLPFPEPFLADEANLMTLTTGSTTDPTTGLPVPGTTTLQTTSGLALTTEPYGRPAMPAQGAVMPFGVNQTAQTAVPYGVPLAVLSVIANGTDQIAVTCSAPHGLATDSQISVEGLNNALANGFFSVVVTSATAFSYQTYSISIPAGSLLGSKVLMITAKIGLPRSFEQIQQVGP